VLQGQGRRLVVPMTYDYSSSLSLLPESLTWQACSTPSALALVSGRRRDRGPSSRPSASFNKVRCMR